MLQDRLQKYRAKRDFTRTAEPAGKVRRTGKGRRYLIQKHAASRLHYDFRLEHNGVLLSWACPKGPSLNTADKRLAVHVEDHPVDYGDFEGTIPRGEYGGGTVMLWDLGTWEPQEGVDIDEALAQGKLAFVLHGKRLRGKWALVQMRSRRPGDRGHDNWLLIKERDEYVSEDGEALIENETTSAKTGRTMEEIAQGGDVWRSNRAEKNGRPKGPAKKAIKAKSTGTTSGAKKKSKHGHAKVPPFIAPQLATLVDAPPSGGEWVHEIKYDGYRALASIAGDTVIIRTRTGLDWTDKFKSLVPSLAALPCDSALLDGEVAVADAQGHTNFGALQDALSAGRGGFGYYLFDLLSLDGRDLRSLPLRQRKQRLEKLLDGAAQPLLYSSHVQGQGGEVFQHACDLKLEGIISKRADDRYHSGRTQSWLKSKCGMEQEFVIVGWEPSNKAGRPFSSILLAAREEGALRYCGHVGSGFSERTLDELAAEFRRREREDAPVDGIPRAAARKARYVDPVLVAEIAFRGWTRDGLVRQGSFKGLRKDKPASAVVRERPMPKAKAAKAAKAAANATPAPPVEKSSGKPGSNAPDEIAGVRVTHPDRILFAEQGVSKRELAEYYEAVAEYMLPHMQGRPLALVRCPDGPAKECFFQKHASPGWPDVFGRIRIREKTRNDEYMYVKNVSGLVGAVQMGVLELHIWCSHADQVEKPDRMVFDLDPDESLDFGVVKSAARDLRKRLEAVGLQSFPMVTGGKGIHIVVPLAPHHTWDEHRGFAEALARLIAEEEPDRYVANMSKAKRRGKIFIDYLRNQRGATAIAPFSARARPGAFVAFPVSWAGLGRLDNAHPATIKTAPAMIRRAKDPWPGYFKLKQSLPLGK
jgi:bifunctional non-homologous end joining protein LigD